MVLVVGGYYHSVLIYNVNVPYSDDFAIALDFLNHFTANNSLQEKIGILFSQHVDHRVFFPRLVVLADYYVQGHVNFYVLVIIGNLGLAGIAWILFKAYPYKENKPLFFCPVVLLLFQLQHWENTGFPTASIQSFYVIFFAFLTLYALHRNTKPFTGLACFAFFMATFTSGSGMFCALPGAFMLFNQKKYRTLILWLLIVAMTASIYFYHYENHSPKFFDLISEKSIELISFFFAVVGGFINFTKAWEAAGTGYPLSLFFGAMTTGLFLYLTFSKYHLRSPVLYSFLFFLFITAAALAFSRSVLYSANELSTVSRYKIVSTAIVSVCYLILIDLAKSRIQPTWISIFIFLGVSYNVYAFRKNIDILIVHTDRLVESSWAVYAKNDYSKLVDWNPESSALVLRESHNRGIYTLPDLQDEYIRRTPGSKELPLISWDSLQPADSTVFYDFNVLSTKNQDVIAIRKGWALVKGKATRMNFFLLKSDTKTYFFSTVGEYRADITEYMKKKDPKDKTNYNDCGFNGSIQMDQLAKGTYEAGVVVQNWDGSNYYIRIDRKTIVD